ncbi:MAG: hypothetical protein CMJ46_05050 [Planctomyces sp.]|nr:hypothetical protein [Planctomyces sp.]
MRIRPLACCCLLASAILLGSLVTWIAGGGPTFATTTVLPAGEISIGATPSRPNETCRLNVRSGFQQAEMESAITTLPEIEFDLPPAQSDCLLVIGCLQGDLLNNDFAITLIDQSKLSEPPATATEWIALDAQPAEQPVDKTRTFTRPVTTIARSAFAIEKNITLTDIRRIFHLYTDGDGNYLDASAYAACETRLVAESEHLRIWLDERDVTEHGDKIQSRLKDLVAAFERIIVSRLMPWLGKVDDIDGDGKFGIVLSSRLEQLSTSDSPLVGLTWSGDYRRDLPAPFGNHADLIYLSPAATNLSLLSEVMAHEYVHALSFQLRQYNRPDTIVARNEEDWINEGLAHVVETRLTGTSENIQTRLDVFEANPESYPLVVTDYVRSGLWRSPGCRGATYSFLSWCDRNSAEGIVGPLLHAEEVGIPNLERVSGRPFSELFRHWSVHRARNAAQTTELRVGTPLTWKQAATSSRSLRLGAHPDSTIRVRIKNESESGVQLTLIPLSDPKAEEALIY